MKITISNDNERSLTAFTNASDRQLASFLARNQKAPKFPRLNFNDSVVQERMMRIGLEARFCGARSEEEVFRLAVATLQNDYTTRMSSPS